MQKFYTLIIMLLLTVTGAIAAAPTTPSSNVSFSSIEGGSLKINFTIGNGARRIIIASQGGPVTANPSNGTDYLFNSTFGLGQEIA